MSIFTPKKLILFGLAAILLIAIPITVYLVQKQQELRSRAAPSTTLSVMPATKTATVGETVSFDIVVDPGTNLVSVLTLVINYDSTKLEASDSAFVKNTQRTLDIIQDPVYTPGAITTTLSTGIDTTNAIISQTTLATVAFKALATTGSTPTEITFAPDPKTLVYALGSEGNLPEENLTVLTTINPARLTITEGSAITPTPTPTATPATTPTPTPSSTITPSPTPTQSPSGATPTPTPTVTPSPTPTATPGSGGPVNQLPSCTSLALDKASSGTAPYLLAFTAAGTDSDGTISKVAFSFGDGTTEDVTSGGGIGTNSVSTAVSHTYNNAGTFSASATLTDNSGGVSSSATCTQTITVTTPQSAPPAVATPVPTIPPSGPGDIIIGIGVIGIILSIIGGLLLFVL